MKRNLLLLSLAVAAMTLMVAGCGSGSQDLSTTTGAKQVGAQTGGPKRSMVSGFGQEASGVPGQAHGIPK